MPFFSEIQRKTIFFRKIAGIKFIDAKLTSSVTAERLIALFKKWRGRRFTRSYLRAQHCDLVASNIDRFRFTDFARKYLRRI